jgi:ureidoglycolate lyase
LSDGHGAALAPYGYLIGPPDSEVKGRIDYYGNAVQVRTPAKFVSNDDMMLNLVTFNRRPPVIRWMEYHNKHTQTFIPLAGRPFIMVLGAPDAQAARRQHRCRSGRFAQPGECPRFLLRRHVRHLHAHRNLA